MTLLTLGKAKIKNRKYAERMALLTMPIEEWDSYEQADQDNPIAGPPDNPDDWTDEAEE